jgi:hypothetical protein
MKVAEEKIVVDGPAGKIDVIMERPDAPRGIALIAHPHPMGGGANTNKVAYTLAKTFVSLGYAAFRPNFRGVGGTEGEHMTKALAKRKTCLPCWPRPNAAVATCRLRWPVSPSARIARLALPNG